MENTNKQDLYAFFPIWEEGKRDKVVKEIADVINRNSIENHSNTPDFILAEHAVKSLESFAATSQWREKWYDKELKIQT